jgi:hypothetical protein
MAGPKQPTSSSGKKHKVNPTDKIHKRYATKLQQFMPLQPSPSENQANTPQVPLDGTSFAEFSEMQSPDYSKAIITQAKEIYNLDRLKNWDGSEQAYLAEGQKQINLLWNAIHGINIHTEMFTVYFLIAIGTILNEIEKHFNKPHQFTKWRDQTFDRRHKRLFQQAQQLANMGNFPKKYGAIGKNRILQLESIRKTMNVPSCEDLLTMSPNVDDIKKFAVPDANISETNAIPLPDLSYDFDGNRLKQHVNSIIILYRLRNAGINYADFDHASLIAEYLNDAITVKDTEELKNWLDQYPEEERSKKFDFYVMDRMKKPSEMESIAKSPISITKIATDLLKYCKTNDIEENVDEWWENQRDYIDQDIIRHGHRLLNIIVSKFETPNSGENQS